MSMTQPKALSTWGTSFKLGSLSTVSVSTSRELQGRRMSMTLSLKSFLPVGHLGLHMNLANATRSRSQGDWSTLGLLLQNGICMSGLPVSSISSGLYLSQGDFRKSIVRPDSTVAGLRDYRIRSLPLPKRRELWSGGTLRNKAFGI